MKKKGCGKMQNTFEEKKRMDTGKVFVGGQTMSSGRHCLTIEERGILTASGVLDVGAVTEEGICATTQLGDLHIRGSNLKVVRLDSSTGELVLSGEIQALSYVQNHPSRSLLSKLFR